jgi:hypothetical protein
VWERGGCLENIQENFISRCSHLDCHGIGTNKMLPMIKGNGIILTIATRRCACKLYFFVEVLNACVNIILLEEGMHAH